MRSGKGVIRTPPILTIQLSYPDDASAISAVVCPHRLPFGCEVFQLLGWINFNYASSNFYTYFIYKGHLYLAEPGQRSATVQSLNGLGEQSERGNPQWIFYHRL